MSLNKKLVCALVIWALYGDVFSQSAGGRSRSSSRSRTTSRSSSSSSSRTSTSRTRSRSSTSGSSRPSCIPNCEVCSSTTCVKCEEGYFEQPNALGFGVTCSQPCTMTGCKRCTTTPDYCVECQYGYFAFTPVPKLECRECIDGCQICRDSQTCDKCESGLKLNETRTECKYDWVYLGIMLGVCCLFTTVCTIAGIVVKFAKK